jgi:hypothetical protein
MRQLFAQLAATHMRHVRDFMLDVQWGQAGVAWVALCDPAVRSLQRAAEKLDYPALSTALGRLNEALRAAQDECRSTIGGASRDALLARYAELVAIMPQAFALETDRTARETVILNALFAQIPNLHKGVVDKLLAAGLSSLEALFLATPDDVAATTGLPLDVAQRVVKQFHAYRDEVRASDLDATRAHERRRLADLTAQLRKQNEEFEAAAAEWSRHADARKKAARYGRERTVLAVNLLLARLGELALLHGLERVCFEQKAAQLETFLDEARKKYGAEA